MNTDMAEQASSDAALGGPVRVHIHLLHRKIALRQTKNRENQPSPPPPSQNFR